MPSERVPREEWERSGEENARQIEDAMSHLENGYDFGFLAEVGRQSLGEDEINFAHMWAEVRELQELFNTLKPVRNRQELWDRFNRFRDRAREAQRWERDRYNMVCNENRNTIQHAIDTLRSDHDLRWIDNWKITQRNLKGFFADAKEVSDLFKELKPLRKEDRNDMWNEFQKLCDEAKYQREQADQAWRGHQRELIDRFQDFIHQNNEKITHLQNKVAEDEDRRDNARTTDFADKVQGWIDEKQERIQETERRNSELMDKIADIEAKLDR